MKVIIYDCPEDNCLKVVHPAPGLSCEDVMERAVPASAKNVRIVNKTSLPADRMFRDAWISSGKRVRADRLKAYDIHVDRLRLMRQPLLDQLDKQVMKHILDPDKLKEIEIHKQRLRDIPQKFKKSHFKITAPLTNWPVDLEYHPAYEEIK